MKVNLTRTVFIIIGLLIITAIFVTAKLGIASTEKENGKKFDKWSVVCQENLNQKLQESQKDKNSQKAKQVCFLQQVLNITKDNKNQTQAVFNFVYKEDKKNIKMIQILPLGFNLQSGTGILSGEEIIIPGAYTFCLQSGCRAVAEISEENLATIFLNKNNAVISVNSENKKIKFPFYINGLKEGLNYIK